ncbi:hypothetical protein GCM10020227_10480 [Streptomyces flavovirens]
MTTADGAARSALKDRVDAVLRGFVDEETALLLAVDAELAPVAEQLRTATAYGKRAAGGVLLLGLAGGGSARQRRAGPGRGRDGAGARGGRGP